MPIINCRKEVFSMKMALLQTNNVDINAVPNALAQLYNGQLVFNDVARKSNNPLMREALAIILLHECQNYLQGTVFVFKEQLVPNMMGFVEGKTPQCYYRYVVVDVDTTKPWTIKRYQDVDGFHEQVVYLASNEAAKLTPDLENGYYLP